MTAPQQPRGYPRRGGHTFALASVGAPYIPGPNDIRTNRLADLCIEARCVVNAVNAVNADYSAGDTGGVLAIIIVVHALIHAPVLGPLLL